MVDQGQVLSKATTDYSLIDLSFSPDRAEFNLHVSAWISVLLIFLVIAWVAWSFWGARRFRSMEIDEAEIGVGSGKIKLKPNNVDRQIAYEIWVELSTRKIGLKIDLENDVIDDIYESWYNYFSVTRDLIKSVPVSRLSDASTRRIVNMSIDILNDGLRPHLTKWQARFRSWYKRQQGLEPIVDDPQQIQKKFPAYSELEADLMAVNRQLIAYRNTMKGLFDENAPVRVERMPLSRTE